MKIINETKFCPKCKENLQLMGLWKLEIELSLDKNGFPDMYAEEIGDLLDFRNLPERPNKLFWKCDECEYKEEIK